MSVDFMTLHDNTSQLHFCTIQFHSFDYKHFIWFQLTSHQLRAHLLTSQHVTINIYNIKHFITFQFYSSLFTTGQFTSLLFFEYKHFISLHLSSIPSKTVHDTSGQVTSPINIIHFISIQHLTALVSSIHLESIPHNRVHVSWLWYISFHIRTPQPMSGHLSSGHCLWL